MSFVGGSKSEYVICYVGYAFPGSLAEALPFSSWIKVGMERCVCFLVYAVFVVRKADGQAQARL